jgi:hypothetical protein
MDFSQPKFAFRLRSVLLVFRHEPLPLFEDVNHGVEPVRTARRILAGSNNS